MSIFPQTVLHYESVAFRCRESLPDSTNLRSMFARKPKIISYLSLFSATLLLVVSGFAQSPRPLLQDIQVVRERTVPVASATPLVSKTGNTAPMVARNSVRTLFPVLADVEIPGYSGVLIESLEGSVVLETNSTGLFNPASNVKIGTAFAVLKTYGPTFRFLTNVYTDGNLDTSTGTLTGNIYVSGRDPMFSYQHAAAIAHELNRLGIRSVTGDLIVTDNFVMNYSGSPVASAHGLFANIDSAKRSPAGTRAWQNHLAYSGRSGTVSAFPGVTFTGGVYVQPMPSNPTLLFSHESAEVREILKATLCYSNNFLSDRLGDLVGGPYAVSRLVQQYAVIEPHEYSLQTSSGLGYNRVSPNAMMKLLRALRADLAKYKMTFADIMPVAGIDKGTLEDRFDTDFSRGSLVGKTGTLGNTDGGVSSLAGEVNTRNGRLLFVIFNQRGSVARFRSFQNSFVSLVQGQFGGASPVSYDGTSLEARLSRTRVSYPNGRVSGE